MLLLGLVLVAAMPVAAKQPAPSANAAVIATWNEHAVARITATGASPTAFNYFAFVHLAMYNAVVGITGEYELYEWNAKAPKGASPEAAAAAAAHQVLRTYFGTTDVIVADLDAKLAASLALVPNGVPKQQGIRYGVRAADRIIDLRMNDGRNALVNVPVADAPGEWSPTPCACGPVLNRMARWRHPDRGGLDHPVRTRCAAGTQLARVPRRPR